jgi:MFS family permease
MSPRQILTVALCVILNMNDGIDVLVVSFSGPDIMQEWGLSKSSMGYVYSMGLLGMMLGSFFISPQSDRFGRKKIFLTSVSMIATGMIGVYFCTGFGQLLLFRLMTGMGIGGILPALAATAAEFSNERHRDFNVSLVQAGWPVGAILTGFVCAYTIPEFGWRSTFLAAGLLALLMMVLVLVVMKDEWKPEPLRSRARLQQLFTKEYKASTLRLWAAIFFGFMTLYTLLSWVPTIAKDAGLPFEMATNVGILLNVGAACGTIVLGWIARFHFMGLRKTVFLFLLIAMAVMLTYGWANLSTPLILILICLIGIFVQGGFNGNYAIMARVYPASLRGTGVGLAVGIGRMGAIIGPSLFGWFSDAGMSIESLFGLFSFPLLITALAVITLQSPNLK